MRKPAPQVSATRGTVNVYHVPERDVRCAAVAVSATCRDTAHWHI